MKMSNTAQKSAKYRAAESLEPCKADRRDPHVLRMPGKMLSARVQFPGPRRPGVMVWWRQLETRSGKKNASKRELALRVDTSKRQAAALKAPAPRTCIAGASFSAPFSFAATKTRIHRRSALSSRTSAPRRGSIVDSEKYPNQRPTAQSAIVSVKRAAPQGSASPRNILARGRAVPHRTAAHPRA